MSSNEIFVYVENKRDVARAVTLELLNCARSLNSGLVCAVYLGDMPPSKLLEGVLFEAGAQKIYQIIDEKLSHYNTKNYSNAILQLVQAKDPKIILFGATKQGRDLAPSISSKLQTGLTADCTKLEVIDFKGEEKLASTRPTFGGSLMATILCKSMPQMASVRENVMKKAKTPYEREGEVEIFNPDLSNCNSSIKILDFIENTKKNIDGMQDAQVVFGAGRGIKTKENYEKLEKLAEALGASLGASRALVDDGIADKERQIGQTGKMVAPKIYVAFGISGALQHMCGVENAQYIVAINKDKDAPIFKNCDLGIVADVQKVIDEMLEAIR
jgi:electron transfer flavoprotein alpha subunit